MELRKPDISRIDADGPPAGDESLFGLPFTEAEANVVLLPVPWDATTSYRRGTALGPRRIRAASRQVDLVDAEYAGLGLPRPWEFGIYMGTIPEAILDLNRQGHELVDAVRDGGPDAAQCARRLDEQGVRVDQYVYEEVLRLHEQQKLVGVVGGEHSVSFGSIRAHAERYPGMGVLQIDAHADLRYAYEGLLRSHASVMYNVVNEVSNVRSLIQVGVRDLSKEELSLIKGTGAIQTFFDHELRARLHEGETWRSVCESVASELPAEVYVSFDIDGLDPALCPHTGTPVPGGLSFAEACYFLSTLQRWGTKVVGFDLTEVAGGEEAEWDGNVGARLLYKLCALTLVTQGARN